MEMMSTIVFENSSFDPVIRFDSIADGGGVRSLGRAERYRELEEGNSGLVVLIS
jgi:hypothetical protein